MKADEPRAQTDFGALIDKAIDRDFREHLRRFLLLYEHVEFGMSRRLRTDEIALILNVLDASRAAAVFGTVGCTEFANLSQRLAAHAADEENLRTPHGTLARNTCFDALACIKALEARLTAGPVLPRPPQNGCLRNDL